MGLKRPRTNLSVVVGFAVSVLAHVLLLVPAMIMVMAARTPTQVVQANFQPEHFRAEEEEEFPEEEPETPLGIENGSTSTMTWVGYEDYQEHLAQLGEIEQAAFSEAPGANATEENPTPPSQAPVGAPSEQTPPQDTPDQRAVREPVDSANEQPIEETPAPEPVTDPKNQPEPADPSQPETLRDTDAEILPETVNEEPVVEPLEAPKAPDPNNKPKPQEKVEPTEAPEQPKEPGKQNQPTQPPPNEPVPPTPASEAGRQTPGDQADKESDATSVVEVPIDKLRPGRPLAAKGLEIKTRRPEFTTLMRLTASPGNPLVEIRFARDGKPKFAAIIESSGDTRIDKAIVSSLYRWRGKGEPLEKLKDEETEDIRIRIILMRRR